MRGQTAFIPRIFALGVSAAKQTSSLFREIIDAGYSGITGLGWSGKLGLHEGLEKTWNTLVELAVEFSLRNDGSTKRLIALALTFRHNIPCPQI